MGEPAYIRVRKGEKVETTVEIIPGVVMADYDANGDLLGIELLELRSANVSLKLANVPLRLEDNEK